MTAQVGRGGLGPAPLALALALALLAAMPWPARAQAEGRIDGLVTNGTSGAAPPAGLDVTVHVLRDRTKLGEHVVRTDELGHFELAGLPVRSGEIYLPIVAYGGASYFPERPVALDDAPQKSVEIRVFEPTREDSALAFDRANLLILDVAPGLLTVMEMGAVVNAGDRTYVGSPAGEGPPATLRFTLPRGATGVTPQAGLPAGALVATPDGFFSTNPVVPGRHELALSYQLPFDGSTLEIAKPLEYPTNTFNLYVPANGPDVASPQLTAGGASELGGGRYQLYTAQGLPAGARIALRFSGLPLPATARAQQLGLAVLGIGLVVLGGAAVVALRRRPAGATPRPAADCESAGGEAERTRLVRALAELDERFTAGTIDEQRYRAERQAGKDRLLALLQGAPPTP